MGRYSLRLCLLGDAISERHWALGRQGEREASQIGITVQRRVISGIGVGASFLVFLGTNKQHLQVERLFTRTVLHEIDTAAFTNPAHRNFLPMRYVSRSLTHRQSRKKQRYMRLTMQSVKSNESRGPGVSTGDRR